MKVPLPIAFMKNASSRFRYGKFSGFQLKKYLITGGLADLGFPMVFTVFWV